MWWTRQIKSLGYIQFDGVLVMVLRQRDLMEFSLFFDEFAQLEGESEKLRFKKLEELSKNIDITKP